MTNAGQVFAGFLLACTLACGRGGDEGEHRHIPIFSVGATPLPWTTNLRGDLALTLWGQQTRYREATLRTLFQTSTLVSVLADDGSIVPSETTFAIREDEPTIFSIVTQPANTLSPGWYHFRIEPVLDAELTSIQEWVKRIDGAYDIPLRVGSEPLLLAVSSCTGESPLVQIKFSEAVSYPNGISESVSVAVNGESLPRSCAIGMNGGFVLDLLCGDLRNINQLEVKVAGVTSREGNPVRTPHSMTDGFDGTITLSESETGCTQWLAFDLR